MATACTGYAFSGKLLLCTLASGDKKATSLSESSPGPSQQGVCWQGGRLQAGAASSVFPCCCQRCPLLVWWDSMGEAFWMPCFETSSLVQWVGQCRYLTSPWAGVVSGAPAAGTEIGEVSAIIPALLGLWGKGCSIPEFLQVCDQDLKGLLVKLLEQKHGLKPSWI